MSRFGLTRYGETVYSTSKYGEAYWYSGEWVSPNFYIGGVLSSPDGVTDPTLDISFQGSFQVTTLDHTDEEMENRSGTWGEESDHIHTSNGSITVDFTGKRLLVHYIGNTSDGGNATYEVKRTSDNTTVTSGTINMGSENGNLTDDISLPSFDVYYVTITRSSGTIRIRSISVECTEVLVYVATSEDGNTFDWSGALTYSLSVEFYNASVSVSENTTHIAIKTELLSSVLDKSPTINKLLLTSGNVAYYAQQGKWSKIIDLGTTPTSIDEITWNWTDPSDGDTKVYTQTQTSDDGETPPGWDGITEIDEANWSALSNPYSLTTHRAQLAEHAPQGSLATVLLHPTWEPVETEGYSSYRWDNIIPHYYASSDTFFTMLITDEHGQEINIEELDGIHDMPLVAICYFERQSNGVSPVLDGISADIEVTYSQEVEIDGNELEPARTSSVFTTASGDYQKGTGISQICQAQEIPGLHIPLKSEVVTYQLANKTMNTNIEVPEPYDITIYWDYESDVSYEDRTNITDNPTEVIYVHCDEPVHTLARRGVVYHGDDIYESIAVFSPPIPGLNKTPNLFAYRLIKGWEGAGYSFSDDFDVAWRSIIEEEQTGMDFGRISFMSIRNDYRVNDIPVNDEVIINSNVEPSTEEQPWASDVYTYYGDVNLEYNTYQQNYQLTNTSLPPVPMEDLVPDSISYNITLRENDLTITGTDVPIVFTETLSDPVVVDDITELTLTAKDLDDDTRLVLDISINSTTWRANILGSSEYTHDVIIGRYWTSDNIISETGTCNVEEDYVSNPLPDLDNPVWGAIPQTVNLDTIRYRIYDDNFLVNTYIEDGKVIGTLGGRRPSRYWNPFIHDGYYYINKDEYYMYVVPVSIDITDQDISHLNTYDLPYRPTRQAPIVIKKPNGDLLRQVAFAREDDNRYVTYLTEPVILNGTSVVTLAYDDIDSNFAINITTEDEQVIPIYPDTTDFSTNQIRLGSYVPEWTWDEHAEEWVKDMVLEEMPYSESKHLKDKEAFVTYQPKDSFVVEYNTPSGDAVEITFSESHDSLNISYEGELQLNEYFATELELNPIRTSHTSGFIYITNSDQDVSDIEIICRPYALRADGYSRATIIINAIDVHQNPVPNTEVTIDTSKLKGTIVPHEDNEGEGIPSMKELMGRNTFIYTAPANIETDTSYDKIVVEYNGLIKEHVIELVKEGA